MSGKKLTTAYSSYGSLRLLMTLMLSLPMIWANQIQLSEVNLNLPVSKCTDCRKVVHTITGFNGCYEWETTHPQLIELKQFSDDGKPQCKSQVQVSVKTQVPQQQLIWIYAKDIGSGELLRCEVRISEVDNIEVLTKLRNIDIDDVQQLYVQGFDSEGNVFSSLEGFRFEWQVTDNPQNLDIISYAIAGYKTTPQRHYMENSKLQTDICLVRGVKTGYATIQVKLSEKGYEDISPAQVDLSVIEPFVIIPPHPIRILTYSKFLFQLARVRFINNTITKQKINLPSRQYDWELSEDDFGAISNDGYFAAGANERQLDLIVSDTQVEGNKAQTMINIARPDAIEIEILDVTHEYSIQSLNEKQYGQEITRQKPLDDELDVIPTSNWNLIKGHLYLVEVYIYDHDKNRILITEDVNLDTDFSQSFFRVIESGKHKYFVEATTTTVDKTDITSTLRHQSNNGLRGQRQAKIFDPVKILHPTDLVLLPFLEKTGQIWHMKAEGGSGQYKWSVEDEKVGVISGQGQVKGGQIGATKIILKDLLNSLNVDEIPLEVQRVEMLGWLEEQIEVQSEHQDFFAYIAYDYQGRKYTNCTSVHVALDVHSVEYLPQNNEYYKIKEFLKGERTLIELRHRFNEQPYANQLDELSPEYKFNSALEYHNNFGVCQIRQFKAGLTAQLIQGQAKFDNIISSPISISIFNKATTLGPDYHYHFDDLYEKQDKTSERAALDKLIKKNTFILAPGSGLHWKIAGATPKWNDYSGQFEIVLPENQDHVSTEISEIELNEIQIYIECLGTQETSQNLQIRMSNGISRKLLRPKTTIAALNVECKVPKDLRIFWAQRSATTADKFPKEYNEENTRSFYVQTNNEGFLRTLALDQQNFAFYNYSSTNLGFSAEIGDNTILESVHYDKVRVKFHQLPETLFIHAKANKYTASGYFSSSTSFTEVNDKIRVHVVQAIDIFPRQKTLLNHEMNTFSLKLLYGSGKYKFRTNCTDTLDIVQHHSQLVLTPKKQGWVEIYATDDAVRDSPDATALILVSDPKRIELLGGGLIEENGQLNLTTKVFDLQNVEFDRPQLVWLTFSWRYEKVGKQGPEIKDNNDLKVQTKPSSKFQDEFDFFGYNAGSYRLNAQLTQPHLLNSNIVKIEIFQPITLYPPKLLLYPGAQWTIQIRGGPDQENSNNIDKRFAIKDQALASIDNFGEVHAHKLGSTKIELKIMYNRVVDKEHGVQVSEKVEVSSAEIDLEIKLITSVDLPINQNRILFTNSVVKLVATLKHGDIPFVHAIGPVSYKWNTGNENTFAALLPKASEIGNSDFQGRKSVYANGQNIDFITHYNYSSVEAQAYSEGDAQVSVQVLVEYPPEYKNERQLFDYNSNIKIIKKISTLIPEYIHADEREPHLYLLPPNAKNRIVANNGQRLYFSNQNHRVVSENCVTDDVIQITQDGYVETSDKFGKSTVTVEENHSLNNQIMMVNIMVTNIHSIAIEESYRTLNMPLGSELQLRVTFQDEHARSFAKQIEGVDIGVAASHPRVIQANLHDFNQTISLKATGSGESNLVLYLEQRPYVLDVIRVKVLSRVWPPSPVYLHLGGEVEFQISEEGSSTPSGHQVRWSTNDNDIIQIDQYTGKARGIKDGHADVFMSNAVSLQSIVKVLRIGRIEMNESTSPKYMTNVKNDPHYQKEYQIDYKLYLEDLVSELPPVVIIDGHKVLDHNVEFICESQQPQIFTARGMKNEPQERFFCQIEILSNHAFISAPSNLLLKVIARNSMDNKQVDRIFSVPYHNTFEVDSSQVKLYSNQRSAIVKVNSNSDIRVVPDNKDLFRYSITKQSDKNTYIVELSVPDSIISPFSDEGVVIQSKVSGEQKRLSIQYEATPTNAKPVSNNSDQEATSKNYSDYQPSQRSNPETEYYNREDRERNSSSRSIVALLVAILIVVCIACYFLLKGQQQVEYENMNPNYNSNLNGLFPQRGATPRGNRSMASPGLNRSLGSPGNVKGSFQRQRF